MKPTAPSLDVMATSSDNGDSTANTNPNPNPNDSPEGAQGQAAGADVDSRSSSSATSPVPADNESDFGSRDSDSSVGIPNMQDMQVTDGSSVCDAPIHQLPNEILINIFTKLEKPVEVLQCMLTCKRWARNAVDLLWHRPSCTSWPKLEIISKALSTPTPYFAYPLFIKRLNLAALAPDLSDGSVSALSVCNRVERLTLTNCKHLTHGGILPLVENSNNLLALDVSQVKSVNPETILAIAQHCKRLQGLNISGCESVTDESLVTLAKSCKYIKRLKLNECHQIHDVSVLAFADHCPNILEIDLHQCGNITDGPITQLLTKGQSLRELRLAACDNITDLAFLSLPAGQTYDHLRILDLTACSALTDLAVQKIVDVAPRLRNLVLAKCRNITDQAVYAISKLGKNLHYVHLGHCLQITDEAVKRLVHNCNRIRYIDLGCCTNLTDESVTRLATLPKLKRIGLVKCSSITDESVLALAKSHSRQRVRRNAVTGAYEPVEPSDYYVSSLERVHLSYCLNLTLKSIIKLLNSCPRLTHLSLTGVSAFLRDEFQRFGRDPPPEFTVHQRNVFCVFSGNCVNKLRDYLNSSPEYASLRDSRYRASRAQPATLPAELTGDWVPGVDGEGEMDEPFEDDVEGLDGSELVPAAPIAIAGPANPTAAASAPSFGNPIPPPPIPAPTQNGGLVGAGLVTVMDDDTPNPTPDPDDG